jgi:hypothetical protein
MVVVVRHTSTPKLEYHPLSAARNTFAEGYFGLKGRTYQEAGEDLVLKFITYALYRISLMLLVWSDEWRWTGHVARKGEGDEKCTQNFSRKT